MKKLLLIACLLMTTISHAQTGSVGIGTLTPHASAQLDITDTTKGVLIPRMSAARRSAIASPATGLLVYQTDGMPGFYYHNGTAWISITNNGAVGSSGIINNAIVTTFAGNGNQGGANGPSTAASFSGPVGVTIDRVGNIYVADYGNHRIRKITQAGVVTTFAGSGNAGSTDGTGTAASFNYPSGITIDGVGNLYVADYGNHKIRKITPAGVVTTFAGSGNAGSIDGIGTAASFNSPNGVAIDLFDNIYVADYRNHKIRKITSVSVVTTFAGSGTIGSTDGTGTTASFNYPTGIVADYPYSYDIYVADYGNSKIRKITQAGVVTTFAGSGNAGSIDGTGTAASFSYPMGVATDVTGNVYVADQGSYKIRKITPAGVVTTFAGSGLVGSTDGIVTAASFNNPGSVAINAAGIVYVADFTNNKIRKISPFNTTYATNASLTGFVAKTGAESINGIKTFSDNLIANGNVGIGTLTPVSKLTVNGGNSDAFTILDGGSTRLMSLSNPASASFSATGGNGVDNATFIVKSAGITYNFTATGLATTSDKRLKQNIALLGNSLQKLMQLNGYSYRYKSNAAQTSKAVGVMAQEVQKVLPEAVYTDKSGTYSVSYTSLVPLLINAMKEQQQQIQAAKKENKALQERLVTVEKALNLKK